MNAAACGVSTPEVRAEPRAVVRRSGRALDFEEYSLPPLRGHDDEANDKVAHHATLRSPLLHRLQKMSVKPTSY
jgi:hypothetical protein